MKNGIINLLIVALVFIITYFTEICNCNNELLTSDIYTKIISLITICIISIFAILSIVLTDFGKFGKADEEKLKAFQRLTSNVFIFLGLVLILISRILNLLSGYQFCYFFIIGLSALGIKITWDLIVILSIKKTNEIEKDNNFNWFTRLINWFTRLIEAFKEKININK